MAQQDNMFVLSFMLCEALHASGPTADELKADNEFTEAKTFLEFAFASVGGWTVQAQKV
jgi:hypothetical protein